MNEKEGGKEKEREREKGGQDDEQQKIDLCVFLKR